MANMCIYAIMVLYDTDVVPLCLIFCSVKWKKTSLISLPQEGDKLIILSVHLKDDEELYNYCRWVDTWPMTACYLPKPEQEK